MSELRVDTKPPAWHERVWRRRMGQPAPLSVGYTRGALLGNLARLVPYRFRRFHRLIAGIGGYFWLPCLLCDRPFGGHEAGGSVPVTSGAPGISVVVCSACTKTR